jgi:hypothetical protein
VVSRDHLGHQVLEDRDRVLSQVVLLDQQQGARMHQGDRYRVLRDISQEDRGHLTGLRDSRAVLDRSRLSKVVAQHSCSLEVRGNLLRGVVGHVERCISARVCACAERTWSGAEPDHGW